MLIIICTCMYMHMYMPGYVYVYMYKYICISICILYYSTPIFSTCDISFFSLVVLIQHISGRCFVTNRADEYDEKYCKYHD